MQRRDLSIDYLWREVFLRPNPLAELFQFPQLRVPKQPKIRRVDLSSMIR